MHLNETRAWPVVKAALLLVLVAAVVAGGVLFVIPALRNGAFGRANESAHGENGPGGVPAALDDVGFGQPGIVQLVRPEGVKALADPFLAGAQILFAVGPELTALDRLLLVDPVTGACTELPAQKQNATLRNPCMDDAYVVYADVSAEGGGAIRVYDRQTEGVRTLCTVAAGVPELMLSTPYLLVQERTAEGLTRLNLWDLSTGESAALALFSDSPFGASRACLRENNVYYADASARADGTGVICTVHLPEGSTESFDPETVVFDPKAAGNALAWLAGNHGASSDLYLQLDGGAPRRIARGAVDFALTAGCAVYNRDETVFACVFENDRTVVLSETGTNAQLAAANDRLVLWRDVTDPDRPVWKYVWIG